MALLELLERLVGLTIFAVPYMGIFLTCDIAASKFVKERWLHHKARPISASLAVNSLQAPLLALLMQYGCFALVCQISRTARAELADRFDSAHFPTEKAPDKFPHDEPWSLVRVDIHAATSCHRNQFSSGRIACLQQCTPNMELNSSRTFHSNKRPHCGHSGQAIQRPNICAHVRSLLCTRMH